MSSLFGSVFGAKPPDDAFERFCRTELWCEVREVLFERASTGIVRGLTLEDGRRVVVKAHQPAQDKEFLSAVLGVQAFLHAEGYAVAVAVPLTGPAQLGRGLGMAQELREEGTWEDPHRPAIRRELARSLATQLELTHRLGSIAALRRGWRLWSGTRPWPPAAAHSPIFDFGATAAGAEWIDTLAARAKRLVRAGGSLEEARAFVADYSAARTRSLSRVEREQIAAAMLYVVTYSARCEHALGRRGDFVEVLERFGADHLEL